MKNENLIVRPEIQNLLKWLDSKIENHSVELIDTGYKYNISCMKVSNFFITAFFVDCADGKRVTFRHSEEDEILKRFSDLRVKLREKKFKKEEILLKSLGELKS